MIVITRIGFLLGYPVQRKNADPGESPAGIKNPRDIPKVKNPGDFRDFSLGLFSGISGFFDLARNKESWSRIPGIGIRDSRSRKNPIPKPTLVLTSSSSKNIVSRFFHDIRAKRKFLSWIEKNDNKNIRWATVWLVSLWWDNLRLIRTLHKMEQLSSYRSTLRFLKLF